MRILILSDPHANMTALGAALDAVTGRWDRAVCLGDVVGYGPDPNEVTSKIREICTKTIRGNHDIGRDSDPTQSNALAFRARPLAERIVPSNPIRLQECAKAFKPKIVHARFQAS